MTRDAKVGLLLGLVFIFVIAFIINGLPGLRKGDGNELTRNMARPTKPDTGIGTAARQVTRNTITPVRSARSANTVQNPPAPAANTSLSKATAINNPFPKIATQPETRYSAPLPNPTTSNETVSLIVPKQDTTSAVERVLAQSRAEKPKPLIIPKQKKEISRPKIYKVKEGDSLALIAKKYYGSEIGNKQATIDTIFKANRKTLKSPDSIFVGQKLVLPVIKGYKDNKNIFSSNKFKPVESVGARTIVNSSTKYYTVKDGDSLWKIAESQLGNGSRYTEIIKTNKFEDADMLTVGEKIKLPQK